jgi:hypothetical protein
MDPLIAALLGGYGVLFGFTVWLFKTYIAEMKASYEARLKDKNEEIAAWRAAANTEAQTSQELTTLVREMKATVDRVARDVRPRPRGEA